MCRSARGQVWGFSSRAEAESRVVPGAAQAFVELLEREREDLAEIEIRSAPLFRHGGFLQEDLPVRQRRSSTTFSSSRMAARSEGVRTGSSSVVSRR